MVAAVIYNEAQDKIFIAKRPDDKHQGGKWEFPGGKVETGESISEALARELNEEIGIHVVHAQPLIQIHHDYPDKSVDLDVWVVTKFTGQAKGAEGQEVKWIVQKELGDYDFPAANLPILQATTLPEVCLITPDPLSTPHFLKAFDKTLKKGISLVQFRAKLLNTEDYIPLAKQVIRQAHSFCAKVILNSPPVLFDEADGLHLTSKQLMAYQQRPMLSTHQTLSASCHSVDELKQAEKLGVDFVFLSPVKQTTSHPDADTIGWQQFSEYVQQINKPVYALGGLGRSDICDARMHGAQGVAAISQFWEEMNEKDY